MLAQMLAQCSAPCSTDGSAPLPPGPALQIFAIPEASFWIAPCTAVNPVAHEYRIVFVSRAQQRGPILARSWSLVDALGTHAASIRIKLGGMLGKRERSSETRRTYSMNCTHIAVWRAESVRIRTPRITALSHKESHGIPRESRFV